MSKSHRAKDAELVLDHGSSSDSSLERAGDRAAPAPQLPGRRQRLHAYMAEDISTRNTDYLLLLVAFGTGVIDAFSFTQAKVFIANMTGNVVFLGLSVAQVSDPFISAKHSVTALCSFWAGAFVTGQISHRLGPTRRAWVVSAFLIQAILTLIVACLLYGKVVVMLEEKDSVLGLLFVLAFCFGGQGVIARGLKVPELPTLVITSAMIDLFNDKNIFKLNNRPRNRRVAFILLLFAGAIVGGVTITHVNDATVVLIAAIIKFLATGFVLLFDSAANANARLQAATAAASRP
ncbi:hypothetical protein PYCC9005_001224 [Savitreella phatthalungensis]